MDTSTLRMRRTKLGQYASYLIPVFVALTAGQGMLRAANVLGAYASVGSTTLITSVTLTCNTATGPGPSATVVVKPLASSSITGTAQVIVEATAASASGTVNGLSGTGAAAVTITPPSSQTLSATNTSLTYTISLANSAAGCNGVTTAAPTFFFDHIVGTTSSPGTVYVGDIQTTVNTTLTATTSGLTLTGSTLASNTLNFTCAYNGVTYYPSGPQTVSIGSTAGTLGTPFTLNTANSLPAAWLVAAFAGVSPATSANPVILTVSLPANQCDSLQTTSGSNTAQTFIKLSSTGFGTTLDVTITVNLTVTAPSASPLIVNPSPITVTCEQNGTTGNYTYVPNYPQTVSVTSTNLAGSTFTIGTNPAIPSWLSLVGTGGTASASAVTFTLQAHGTCNAGVAATTTIHLLVAGSLDKVFQVSLQVATSVILTAMPNPASFTYVKLSGTAGFADLNITSSVSGAYFSINDVTLPSWLRTDTDSGTAPRSIRFSSTTVADTLAPGTYTANVVFSVSGYGDLTVPVSMLLTNKAPTLSVVGLNPVQINWIIGQGLPTPTITALSTDTPIAYTATTGGSLQPVIATGEASGLAYSFGTPITVSFSPQVFAGAQPGNVLTGTVTLSYGNPVATIVVTFDITVLSPGATISSLSPSTLPNGLSTYTLSLVGTGFVPSGNATRVGIVTTPGSAMTFDPAIGVNIINQSNILLTLTYPTGGDPNIPFTAPGHMTIGVCNPVGGTCSIATASVLLYFGSAPIIQGVTSSSSLLQGNGTVSTAPYDMISIFGSNFCPECSTTTVLANSPDPVLLTYAKSITHVNPANSLTNNTSSPITNTLTVQFQVHSSHALIDTAPILFATNGQINLTVPSTVTAGVATDIVVSYGATTPQLSAAFPVAIAATDPGIFTVGADGQGSAAALDANYNLISAANPAGIRNGVASLGVPETGVSDAIAIYMTGLGKPDSSADNSSAGSSAYSTDCVSIATYLNGTPSFNTATGASLATLDGALIIPSVLSTGRLVPCISTGGTDAVTATIGGQTATVQYAGWVPGTIAGLYQVNLLLPDNTGSIFTTEAGAANQAIVAPVQLPVTITSNLLSTQTGVSIWVAPRLRMLGPVSNSTPNTMSVTVGTALSNTYAIANAVSATHGSGVYTYAVTSGLLPSGLSIIASGTGAGLIVGTPAANTGNPGSNSYTVTVTASDNSAIPVTGTVTFVVTVGQGLFLTNATPGASHFGLANANISRVIASGGTAPYFYTLPSGFTAATGIAIDPSSGTVSTSATTPAGTYPLTINVQDSSSTPIQGTTHIPIVVNLEVTAGTLSAGTHGAASTVYTAPTVIGYTGDTSVTYALDTVSSGLPWLTLNADGSLAITTGAGPGTYPITITATDGSIATDATVAGTATISLSLVIN